MNVFRVFILGKSYPTRAEPLVKAAVGALERFESEQVDEVFKLLLIGEDARSSHR